MYITVSLLKESMRQPIRSAINRGPLVRSPRHKQKTYITANLRKHAGYLKIIEHEYIKRDVG